MSTTSSHLTANIVLFGRMLRAHGIPITPQRTSDAIAGLAFIDLRNREDVKNVYRTVFVSHHDQLALFDRIFDLFWRQWQIEGQPRRAMVKEHTLTKEEQTVEYLMLSPLNGQAARHEAEEETHWRYSPMEILRHKPFSRLTPAELESLQQILRTMTWKTARRRSRRKQPAGRGPYVDRRRAFRLNLQYGGDPILLPRRVPKTKARPIVVLCDVSGSMEHYARILLQFLYGFSHGLTDVEAFIFSTRLTRITWQLRRHAIETALNQISLQAQDMGGGTLIGHALKEFNYRWGRRVLSRGAITLIISDGWDRGDPGEIDKQMERLRLSSYRLIWLNPLLGQRDYQPLTRGMKAALPYIDEFRPIHNLHSLHQLVTILSELNPHPRRSSPSLLAHLPDGRSLTSPTRI